MKQKSVFTSSRLSPNNSEAKVNITSFKVKGKQARASLEEMTALQEKGGI